MIFSLFFQNFLQLQMRIENTNLRGSAEEFNLGVEVRGLPAITQLALQARPKMEHGVAPKAQPNPRQGNHPHSRLNIYLETLSFQ